MNRDKVLGMIGLAKRAGKVVSGEFLCDKAIKEGRSRLVIIACDASEMTKKAVKDACAFYKVECFEYADKESLGSFTGSDIRAVVSINDENFAQEIVKRYNKTLI
ncbi:MAG: ribosomal L7Ae/L30e/S12e/Gadd45 family protein [Clostridia bacterium]|nr:ribosomal L7Ae/L30e/S12e/Gadd45 family protein [Clostridia bacterium]